jgi:hypothetical protein
MPEKALDAGETLLGSPVRVGRLPPEAELAAVVP